MKQRSDMTKLALSLWHTLKGFYGCALDEERSFPKGEEHLGFLFTGASSHPFASTYSHKRTSQSVDHHEQNVPRTIICIFCNRIALRMAGDLLLLPWMGRLFKFNQCHLIPRMTHFIISEFHWQYVSFFGALGQIIWWKTKLRDCNLLRRAGEEATRCVERQVET